jgi:ABC-2 type transport system permease protein
MSDISNGIRVFFSSAVFSFRAQFDWLNPPMWLTMKLVLSLSQMAFFVFVGTFASTSSGVPVTQLVAFIAIGNALQSLSWNTVFSVINITGHDKWDGTLPLVLATPAHRLPLFIGRAMVHVLDGLLSVAIGFVFAAFLFGVNFGNADPLALSVTVLLTGFTMAGFGLLVGGLSFHFRNPMVFANIFTFILLIFCGVNFPVSDLPGFLQPLSYAFPLTYGTTAARNAIAGSTIIEISPILAQQLVVGIIAMLIGYYFFKAFEQSARKTGKIEAL